MAHAYPGIPIDHSVALLSIKSDLGMQNAIDHLTRIGVEFRLFREPDLQNRVTAVCTVPVAGEPRNSLRKYQLLKERYSQREIERE